MINWHFIIIKFKPSKKKKYWFIMFTQQFLPKTLIQTLTLSFYPLFYNLLNKGPKCTMPRDSSFIVWNACLTQFFTEVALL